MKIFKHIFLSSVFLFFLNGCNTQNAIDDDKSTENSIKEQAYEMPRTQFIGPRE